MYTLPETNIASENQWLENEISYWGPAYFQGLGSVYFRDWKARRNRHTAKFFDFSLTKWIVNFETTMFDCLYEVLFAISFDYLPEN